jgi:hypothetical protein
LVGESALMPTFDFTSPEGKTYSVDGPDGATKEQAFQILQQSLGAAPPPAENGSTLGGIAKSAGVGAAEGLIGMAGIPGDLLQLGLNAIGDNKPASGFGSQAIKKKVEQYTGEFYKPQGTAEQYAQTAGNFLPAVIGGPETLATKLATRVAIPAAASEVAGALSNDNPYVKGAAAIASGGVGTLAARKFQAAAAARTAATSATPSYEQLLKSGSAGFDAGRDMNIVVKPNFAEDTAADIRDAIKGYSPKGVALVHDSANDLENLARSAPGLPPTAVEMNKIEDIRKQLSSLRTNADGSIRSAAQKALDVLTGNQMKLTAADTLSGDAPLYAQTMKNAVSDYGAGKRAATLQGKMNLAELNHGSPVGMLDNGSIGQALQRVMKQLARPINNTNIPVATKLGFNKDEVGMIRQAALGNGWTGAGELLGLAPGRLGAIPAAIAQHIGGLSTQRQIAALDSLVRSRSALAAQVAAKLAPQVVQKLPAKTVRILQALSRSDPALNAITQQSSAIGQSAAQ